MRLCKRIIETYPIPNDPDDAQIDVLHLLPGEVEDLNEEVGAFKTVVRKDEEGKMSPELEQAARLGDRRYLPAVKAVARWRGFKEESGEDMACTKENVIRVAREAEISVTRDNGEIEVISFLAFVNECRADLAKRVATRKAEEEKN